MAPSQELCGGSGRLTTRPPLYQQWWPSYQPQRTANLLQSFLLQFSQTVLILSRTSNTTPTQKQLSTGNNNSALAYVLERSLFAHFQTSLAQRDNKPGNSSHSRRPSNFPSRHNQNMSHYESSSKSAHNIQLPPAEEKVERKKSKGTCEGESPSQDTFSEIACPIYHSFYSPTRPLHPLL